MRCRPRWKPLLTILRLAQMHWLILYGCGFAYTHASKSASFTISTSLHVCGICTDKWMRSFCSLASARRMILFLRTIKIYPLKRYDHNESKELSIPHYLNTKFMLENIYRLMYFRFGVGVWVYVYCCTVKWIRHTYGWEIHWKCNVHPISLFHLRKPYTHARIVKMTTVYLNDTRPYLPKRLPFSINSNPSSRKGGNRYCNGQE